MPQSNDESVADLLAQAEALLKELRENPPSEEEIREAKFNRNPFEEIARGLTQATELEKVIDGDMTPDCPPDDLAALADAKATLMRQRKLLLEDWEWELSQTYPPSN